MVYHGLWRRWTALMCGVGALLAALPAGAVQMEGLTVRGDGILARGAACHLEVDLGDPDFNSRRMVTITDYLAEEPQDYVRDGLVLSLEDAGEGTLPGEAGRALSGGSYTVEFFARSAEGGALLTAGGAGEGWSLSLDARGDLELEIGRADAGLPDALGVPCAVTVRYDEGTRSGVLYRDGRPAASFEPGDGMELEELTLAGGAELYSLRIYDRALGEEELRNNAALDRSRFLGETADALLVQGAPLDESGVTKLNLPFEHGVARLSVESAALGRQSFTLTVGEKSCRVELETVSPLEAALALSPERVEVTVSPEATALEVRTAVAVRVEEELAPAALPAAGGTIQVLGSEKKGFRLRLTQDGQTHTLPLEVRVLRQKLRGEAALEKMLDEVMQRGFSFAGAEDITAQAIAGQVSELLRPEEVSVCAEWSEEARVWLLRLERDGCSVERPLYLNSDAEVRLDDPAFLNSCSVRLVGDESAYVSGGGLHVAGTAGGGYEAVVLPVWNIDRNFCIEAQVRLTAAADETRWCGVAYGVRPVSGGRPDQFSFWQVALRENTAASNGVECAQMLTGGAWSTQKAAAWREAADPQRVYTVTVLYRDGVVCHYIDGELVLRVDVPDPSAMDGRVAFTFDRAAAELVGLKVTGELPDLPMEQPQAENGYDALLYEPGTGLVMSPTVVAEQPAGAAATAGAERRPTTLVRTVYPDLTVEDNGSRISPVEFLHRLDRRVLAGFRIEDLETARAFAQYVSANGLVDISVFSSSEEVLRAACGGRPGVRGVLDYSSGLPDGPVEAVFAANRAGARVVVLPQSAAGRETVRALQIRAVSVWINTDTDRLYEAILSGADGLLVEDYEGALDAIEHFDSARKVLTRAPTVTAHRGLHEEAPENTVRAAVLAVEAGAEAIECDVQLSADGVAMVSHDGTTGGQMGENLSIAQSTREQLQRLSFLYQARPGDRMPTLAELLESVQGTPGGEDVVFLVELKGTDPALIPAVANTVRESGRTGQVVFLSFDPEHLQRIRALMPEASVGLLASCTQSGLDTATNLKALSEHLDPLNAFYSCPQEDQSTELARAARHRGIRFHPWTVNRYELFEQKYYDGYHGITTDRPDYASYYLAGVEAPNTEITLQAGEEHAQGLPVVESVRTGETSRVAAQQVLQIGGEVLVETDGTGRVWSEEPGTARVLLGVTFTLPATQIPYTMYTGPVTLRFSGP